MNVKHPVNDRLAAIFHAKFVVLYALALGFHLASAVAHWRSR